MNAEIDCCQSTFQLCEYGPVFLKPFEIAKHVVANSALELWYLNFFRSRIGKNLFLKLAYHQLKRRAQNKKNKYKNATPNNGILMHSRDQDIRGNSLSRGQPECVKYKFCWS